MGLFRSLAASARFRAIAVLAVLSAIGGIAVMAPYHGARPNVLVQVHSDVVLVSREGDPSFIRIARSDVLRPGDTLRTDAHGRAIVTYADGTTVLIVESSEFSYVVSETSLGEIVVTMLQSTGRMWYRFSRVLSPGARYELRFPVGAAVVRAGTAFDASVDSDGTTTVVSSDGTVEVVAAGVTVPVAPNQQTVVRPGSAPAAPSATSPQAPPTPEPSSTNAPNATPSAPPASPQPTRQPTTPLPAPTWVPTPTPVPTPTVTPKPLPSASLPVPSILPTPSPTPAASATPTATPAPSILPLPTVSPLPISTLPPVP